MLNQSTDSQVKASMLAIFARAYATDEFINSPDCIKLQLTITIEQDGNHAIDVETYSVNNFPLGGGSL